MSLKLNRSPTPSLSLCFIVTIIRSRISEKIRERVREEIAEKEEQIFESGCNDRCAPANLADCLIAWSRVIAIDLPPLCGSADCRRAGARERGRARVCVRVTLE